MISNGYASLVEFREHLSEDSTQTDHDSQYERVIEAASRAIDNFCLVRPGTFTLASAVSAREYLATDLCRVTVDPFGTTTGLLVKSDAGNDGTFETSWTITTNFIVEPVNAIADGLPATRIRLVDGQYFPQSYYGRPQVQVTAKWGYPSTPLPVKQACLLVAAEQWKRQDAPFGTLQTVEFGPIRLSADALRAVSSLLQPYRYAGGHAIG